MVLSCLQTGNEVAIEKQVDKNNYSDDELISIKTTLHLPYYTSSPYYERAYGSITIGGKDYEYVKRRVYHDTLEVLCLPNQGKTALKAFGNDIAKSSADGQASAPAKKSGTTVKISLPDFCQSQKTNTVSFSVIAKELHVLLNTNFLPANYSSELERPPQLMPVLSLS